VSVDAFGLVSALRG